MPPTTTRNGVGLRPRRASRIDYASLNSVGEILVRQDTTTPKPNADFVTEIVPCSVLLKALTFSELDRYGCTGLTGINPSKTGTSVTNKGSKTITRSNASLSERFSNVTRRTKLRRTENLPSVKQNETAKQRHTISIVDCSIISLDGSTNDSRMALKSQNLPSPKLTRRRASLTKTGAIEPQTKAIEVSTDNFQTSRSASKRKQESSVPDTGVSPPKKVLEDHVSIVEISIDREEGTAQEIIEHPTEATASTSAAQIKSVPKPDGNASKKLPIEPFKDLIVSVKRVGPAMTEAELRSLKYYDPDSTKDAINDDHRRSALGEDRKTIGQKKRSNRITFANKPQNVIASPIAEDPEPVSPKLDNNRTISGQRRRSIRLSLSAKLTPNDRAIDISSSLPDDPEPTGSKFDENRKLIEQKQRSSRSSLPTQAKATNRPIIISSPIAEDPEPIILEPPILMEIQTQAHGIEENHKNVLQKRRQTRSSMSTGSQMVISDLITEDPVPANSEQSMEMDSNSNKHSAEDNSAKQIEMKRRSSRLSFSNRPKLTNQQIVISSPIVEEPINLELEVTQIDASLNRHSTDGTRNAIEQKRSVSRLSLATKPQIIVSAPITESSAATDRSETDTNGNRLLPPDAKKVQNIKQSPLSYAIEEEENGEDVYEFQSCSQTSETLLQSKVRKKPGRKPKPKNDATKPVKKPAKKKKPAGTKNTVSWKPGHNNPFGCNRKQLANVIKHIGGGPVKPPVTVDYVVNLELPTTPHSTVDRGQQHNRDEIIDLPYHAASDLPERVPTHPTVEKLKKGASLQQPKTSTPVIKLTEAAPTPPSNPVSPWRLQDDHIIPRTSYMPRNKEMLPSYDSFFVEENSTSAPPKPNAPVSLVTERRKPPSGVQRSVQVSKKDIREVERMHRGLLAITEMSQRLITSMRRNKAVPGLQNCPEYEADVKEACVKLKQWYKSSKKDFHRSLHILNKIQHATDNDQMDSCPSPLTTDQQHTLECFNQSTDRFRTMIDEMQAAMNDSNVENCSPPLPPKQAKSSSIQQPSQQPSKVSDVIILPQRLTHGPTRNPLVPLNFVPLPQRTSPLISPLAVNDRGVASLAQENVPDSADNNIRRKLQYDNTKENEKETVQEKPPATEPFDKDTTKQRSVDTTVLDDVNHSANAILKVAAYEVVSDSNSSADTSCSIDNLFGFDEDEPSQESSTQVTLPLPANISTKTLKQSLANVRQFIPKQPIFRRQPKPTPSTSGGPTRLPTVKLRVFGSPTKRPSHTLREFVASTPRAELSLLAATATTPIAGTSKSTQLLPVATTPQGQQAIALEAPDISAIESLNTTVAAKQHPNDGKEPEVVLFDTPEDSHINRSALHRTYTRVPRRRRKRKNIFLANLGLDDDEDDEDDEDAAGDPVPVDSDSDVGRGNTRKRKDRTKKRRRKPKPVEETAEFKQFVEEFNSMCEVVERFQPIIE